MSERQCTDASILRPQLHESIERLPAEDLEAVHRLLTEIEMRSLYERVSAQGDDDQASGRVAAYVVQAAIEAYRQQHPYR